MNITTTFEPLKDTPLLAMLAFLLISLAAYLLFRFLMAHWLTGLAKRSANTFDDILIKHLRPKLLSWVAPLVVIYISARYFPGQQILISKVSLFIILWIAAITLASLLHAVNIMYEKRKNYSGVSIAGYLDIGKLLVILMAIILSITIITDKSPVVLLTSLGAVAAILILIFQNTILSLVASIQIAANDLIKEGDWVEVPGYDADGDVENINLHTIKIRNFDMTYSIIPTHKIMDVSFRNWRGMQESGGRRIQRSILLDQLSIKFCSIEMLRKLQKIDLIADFLNNKILQLEGYEQEHQDHYDLPLDGPQVTNIEVFRAYIEGYLKKRPDIHLEKMPFLVRVLEPKPTGLPVELYIFTKTTEWEAYEAIQAQIFDHLLAAVKVFDLRVFQEPTGLDFSALAREVNRSSV